MKSFILRAGLLTCLIFLGLSYHQAFAAEMTFPSKCTSFGPIPQNQNPSPQQINCLLTNAALEADIPPEVVKAVAEQESGGWKQFDDSGQPLISSDGGIGVMQITNQQNYDQNQLKNNIVYNIEAGVEILSGMYNRTDLPKIKDAGRDVIENWYFPVMAYNGTVQVNSPLVQASGITNAKAYQEKVFALLEQDSFLNDSPLAKYPFTTADFTYQTGDKITFNKLEYTLTGQMHASAYLFKTGDHVVVTMDGVRLRSVSDSTNDSTILATLAKNTPLIITGDFVYDKSNGNNRFVWYPVKTEDQKFAGFISSAYITKKLAAPVVSPVDDNDVKISGKAPANDRVQVMYGTSLIGSGQADAGGTFNVGIAPLKAGTKLTVTYKDSLNAPSLPATVTVADKTAPAAPSVNKVTNTSIAITGKTEANATVTVTIAGKTYSTKSDPYGNFKVGIPVQNTGTSLSVTAKDTAGNVSKAKTATVVRTAPNMPTVNIVKYYSTSVTGNTEKYAIVAVKIGSRTYTSKANIYGSYKVNIPKQRAGTKLYVNAKDAKGQISSTRVVTVSR